MKRVNFGIGGLALALAAMFACTASTPSPEPQRSPSPTLPSCITTADCVGGEECRDGVCTRDPSVGDAGLEDDAEINGPACTPACEPTQVCASGTCIGPTETDAGEIQPSEPPRHEDQ